MVRPFRFQMQGIKLSCKVSDWPFRSSKQSGIKSISTSLMQLWNFGSSLLDEEFEEEK